MRRNNQWVSNEHAGAIWVWLMCILSCASFALLVVELHSLWRYASQGAWVTTTRPDYSLALGLDIMLVAGMLLVARHWEMGEDIKRAWLHLWRWALAYLGVLAALFFSYGFNPALLLVVLGLGSYGFVVLGERQAQIQEIGVTIKRLAEGDTSAQLDEGPMRGDLREIAQNVNRLAHASAVAADERSEALRKSLIAEQEKLRADRLRTELIANVSHDLKTPLTSVINYADLLSTELSTSPGSRDEDKLSECADVLERQSQRLRKLIEDLIEASKAQTGNIAVHLMPLDAAVLVSQAAGEWSERLAERDIALVCETPDEPLMINADSRQMGRVFDNILGNVVKYGLPGTRAYFTARACGDGTIEMSCKNTSAAALNISADELLERFVRGDASRTTEGSGLGLSIAQSLMELQNGRLTLAVDADLFTVNLSFPGRRGDRDLAS